MKRLTKYDKFGNAELIGIDNTKLYERLVCDETVALTIATNKLSELEDVLEKWHIENLEGYISALIEARNIAIDEKKIQFKKYIEEVAKRENLERELAELKQKAIVSKFRTYQPIFYITQFYTSTKGNPEYDIISDKYYVAENENEIILGWNYAKDFNQRKYYYVRKDWVFATKEEAQAKLEELGEKDE